jgi:RNA polymerase sigma factor (sigma-70 family)
VAEGPSPDGDSANDPATHWSRLAIPDSSPAALARARDYFFQRYREVLFRFFRRNGLSHEDAADAVQEFFTSSFEKGLLERADPTRGRFRGYLRTAASSFLIDARRTSHRKKRRPDGAVRSLDRIGDPDMGSGWEPAADDGTPEEAFDRDYARTILDGAKAALLGAALERGRPVEYKVFEMRYLEGTAPREIASAVELPIEGSTRFARKRRKTSPASSGTRSPRRWSGTRSTTRSSS